MILLLLVAMTACAAAPPKPPVLAHTEPVSPAPRARARAMEPTALTPWEAEVALFEALNRERDGRHTPPLHIDRGLALVAQVTAGEYRRLGRGAEARLIAAADHDLAGFAMTFEHTLSAVCFAERLEEAAAALGVALDPSMHWVGIAVVPAPPPVGPRGGYGVVLTLGQ
jgi:hypothetical protein